MNLAQSTRQVLEELDVLPDVGSPLEKPLPWRQSLGLKRRDENVRPIFWRNRQRAYVERTQDWDEFPNGRWGDSRSPAFGELDAYDIGLKGSNETNRKLWGEPKSIQDISAVFVKYMKGELDSLPWSEQKITSEANSISNKLVDLNSRGFFTINSQPPVNGVKSNHSEYGWGPKNGFCYQKAYLEVLVSPDLISEVISRIDSDDDYTYYAVNRHGDLQTNAPGDGPNAVTWGVFPGKEIVQPTVVETISFLAWKDEFYKLGLDWAHCHDAATPSRHLLESTMENWYLVNIVHNDFTVEDGIFAIFKGLKVKDAEKLFEPRNTNGTDRHAETNGVDGAPETDGEGVNGVSGINGRSETKVDDAANRANGGEQVNGNRELNGVKKVNGETAGHN